jgi:hypothetical protein
VLGWLMASSFLKYAHITQKQHTSSKNSQKTTKEKWATFTYYGPETRMIIKSFKNTSIGIAFKTNNTMKTN